MYKHLTIVQRYYIERRMSNNVSVADIGKEIKVHISTIYREINRNKMDNGNYYYLVPGRKPHLFKISDKNFYNF